MGKERKTAGFRAAYSRIPRGDTRLVMKRLMEIFGVTCDAGIYSYINGHRRISIQEARDIEALFAEYGVEVKWETGNSINN
jgi:hypothetical protein